MKWDTVIGDTAGKSGTLLYCRYSNNAGVSGTLLYVATVGGSGTKL